MFSMIDAMIKSMQQRSHHKAILGQISTHLLAQHLHSEEFSYLLTVILSKLSSVTWSDLHTHNGVSCHNAPVSMAQVCKLSHLQSLVHTWKNLVRSKSLTWCSM